MRYVLATITVLVLIALAVVNVTYKPHSQANQAVSQGFYSPQALLTIINRERASMGVQPLKLDSRLNASAQAKVDDMVFNKYYGHVNPKTGLHGYEYAKQTTSGCYMIDENITLTYRGGNPVTDKKLGWDYSPIHKSAQDNPNYDLVGFASEMSVSGARYYVAHFCDLR